LPEDTADKAPVLCVLGLGSNLPYKGLSCVELVNSAAADLQATLTEFRLSPLYKTAPLHVTDQEMFINAAVTGFTVHAARKLLGIVHETEARYGRDRAAERRWGERSLDIDILLFGDMVVTEDDLVIPHPRLKERAFALRPLLDLLPDAREPGTGKKYRTMLKALPFQEIQRCNY